MTAPQTHEDWLRWLGEHARGHHDPVCPDAAGDACLWALAEIDRLREARSVLGDALSTAWSDASEALSGARTAVARLELAIHAIEHTGAVE